ncbi:uncharacterized protein BCR38DRAFT_450877 [Pseudomassariella vexata]|uniref:NTF2 domain-containing protein n=1 Tax=Pseudomassariella vexata TaxID=1141098 RepID=A0A1Y2DDB6_9PEZI|nr:uncharacterized protein BCR38DRAFT_450877 [Pseudomassariella vexata]ORY56685.1 hypothetical protein BCR38DRAFT_450877 [Pseudomassariella vexata]
MALQTSYKQFLAAPNSSLLNPDATLHYITTTTSFKGATEIIKHFSTSRNQVKKKREEFLGVIEGQNAAAFEVDTVLEFVTSGGPYLPGLDDNFLSDRTVYLLVMHIVTFDADGKILQIRENWDQAALLKQLDIIGKTGRNWPIRDSKEQIKMIENCLKSSGEGDVPASADLAARLRANSNNILRDPHASLALFAPREETEQAATAAAVISPRAGSRPPQRAFTDIVSDEPPEDAGSSNRSESPSKGVTSKAGAGKNYQPSRLFEAQEEEAEDEDDTPERQIVERAYRPNPTRYDHFDFADGSEEQDDPIPGPSAAPQTKHGSQWSFDDFVTPAKAKPTRVLQKSHQDVRHWGTENDEVPETPVRKPVVGKPRRDAEPHFEFVDDGTPKGPRVERPQGAKHNKGLGLYKNNVYSEGEEDDDETAPSAGDSQALGNITNLKGRGQALKSQFARTDESPAPKPQVKPSVDEDRKKAVKTMDTNRSSYDEPPASQKENQPTKSKPTKPGDNRGIAIGGDGMGGPKGTQRNWLFGEDEEPVTKSVPGRKQGGSSAGGFSWDF